MKKAAWIVIAIAAAVGGYVWYQGSQSWVVWKEGSRTVFAYRVNENTELQFSCVPGGSGDKFLGMAVRLPGMVLRGGDGPDIAWQSNNQSRTYQGIAQYGGDRAAVFDLAGVLQMVGDLKSSNRAVVTVTTANYQSFSWGFVPPSAAETREAMEGFRRACL